jgi:hypothetical protein
MSGLGGAVLTMDQPLPVHPGERTSSDRPDWSVPEAEIAGRSIAMMIVESGNRGRVGRRQLGDVLDTACLQIGLAGLLAFP